jgi:hypothetical protein
MVSTTNQYKDDRPYVKQHVKEVFDIEVKPHSALVLVVNQISDD